MPPLYSRSFNNPKLQNWNMLAYLLQISVCITSRETVVVRSFSDALIPVSFYLGWRSRIVELTTRFQMSSSGMSGVLPPLSIYFMALCLFNESNIFTCATK
jgi:hypothetical protein